MFPVLLRALVATVLLIGTLAPSVRAAAKQAQDDAYGDCESTLATIGACEDDSPGDCHNCSAGCACACCALRAGAVFPRPLAFALEDPVALEPRPIGQLSPVSAPADIFHPPRA